MCRRSFKKKRNNNKNNADLKLALESEAIDMYKNTPEELKMRLDNLSLRGR